jgi:HEAT repeat protein
MLRTGAVPAILFTLTVFPCSLFAGDDGKTPMKTVSEPGASRAARIRAAKSLARSKDLRAIDALIKGLPIMDDEVVLAIKDALRALNAGPILDRRLRDRSSSVEEKVSACIGLRVLRQRSAMASLVLALDDGSPRVRKEAALAIGVIAPAEAEHALVAALSDGDADVRYFAADALGEVRTAAVRKAIEHRLVEETDPVVRSALLATRNKLDRPPAF